MRDGFDAGLPETRTNCQGNKKWSIRIDVAECASRASPSSREEKERAPPLFARERARCLGRLLLKVRAQEAVSFVRSLSREEKTTGATPAAPRVAHRRPAPNERYRFVRFFVFGFSHLGLESFRIVSALWSRIESVSEEPLSPALETRALEMVPSLETRLERRLCQKSPREFVHSSLLSNAGRRRGRPRAPAC